MTSITWEDIAEMQEKLKQSRDRHEQNGGKYIVMNMTCDFCGNPITVILDKTPAYWVCSNRWCDNRGEVVNSA